MCITSLYRLIFWDLQDSHVYESIGTCLLIQYTSVSYIAVQHLKFKVQYGVAKLYDWLMSCIIGRVKVEKYADCFCQVYDDKLCTLSAKRNTQNKTEPIAFG